MMPTAHKNVWMSVICAAMLWSHAAFAATTQQASDYIQQVSNQTVSILKSGSSKPQKQTALSQIFATNVDFPWVARFVMGRYWREASDTQKNEYVQQYQRFLVRHYSMLFSEYDGGSFSITGARDDGDDEFSIGMQVRAGDQSAEPIIIDYKVRMVDGTFKIFDVVIEGVSMLTTQRSEFSSVIAGNNIDYLIQMLKKKADSPVTKKS